MDDRREDLLKVYGGMRTDALLELYAEGVLTEEARGILESVLESRSVPIPRRQNRKSKDKERKEKTSSSWAMRLAFLGVTLPVICLALNFEPMALRRVCELCWPSAFLLFAADGRFDLAIYTISIIANGFVWAGLGWLIGYGLSARR